MYPQQYQEFLDFLDSNPEYLHDMRVRLLTPELIALPEQFAQLVATVTDIAERFATFVDTTNNRLTTMNDNISRLNGSDLERRAREIILNIAKDELGLTRGHILLAQGKDTAPAFENTMTQAEDKGIIAGTGIRCDGRRPDHPGPTERGQKVRARRIRGLPHHRKRRHRKGGETRSNRGPGNRRRNHRRRHRAKNTAATTDRGSCNRGPGTPARHTQAGTGQRSTGSLKRNQPNPEGPTPVHWNRNTAPRSTHTRAGQEAGVFIHKTTLPNAVTAPTTVATLFAAQATAPGK